MMQRRTYPDGGPCTNAASGCTGTYLRSQHTSGGRCRDCYNDLLRSRQVRVGPKPCACGCGKLVHAKKGGARYATKACRPSRKVRVWDDARRQTKAQRHPKARYVYEAMAESEPGMCPWGCEKPLPPRRVNNCGSPECHRAWGRAYRAGRSEVERKPLLPRECGGCKGTFTPERTGTFTCSPECSRTRSNRMTAERRTRERAARAPKRRGRPSRAAGAFLFGRAAGPKVLRPFY